MPLKYTPTGLPVIETKSGEFVLGATRPEPELRASFKAYSQHYPIVPRAQWREVDYRFYKSPTWNQAQHGSCSGHAGVKAFDYNRRVAGMKPVELSPTFAYAQLNGGRDRGASVSAVMRVLMQMGTCLRAECGVDQIFQNQIPQTAYQTALQYKLQDAFVIRTFDELGSALVLFGPAAIGILIGQNFGRLDANGVAPLPVATAGGHALAVPALHLVRGEWCPLAQNSWGPNFGFDGGFAYITERHTYRMLDGFALVIPKESGDIELDDEPPHAKYQRLLRRQYGLFQGPIPKEIVVNVPAAPPPAAPVKEEAPVTAPVKETKQDIPAEEAKSNVSVQPVEDKTPSAGTVTEEPFKLPSLQDILLRRAMAPVDPLKAMMLEEDKKVLENIQQNQPPEEPKTAGDLIAEKQQSVQEFAETKAAEQPPAPVPVPKVEQPPIQGQGGKAKKKGK